ncbi:MAG TPA: hypothetical protein VMF30_15085 [Pirellulales bacterium]|nr:hypothetical protein [Pirellulales bacterium]
MLLVLAVAGGMVAKRVNLAREAALLSACDCRMCGLSSSLAHYYDAHKTFPAEYNEDRRNALRWDESLGGLDHRPIDCDCPSGRGRFAAICGPGAIFDGVHPTRPDEVTDGCENTLVLIELSRQEIASAGNGGPRLSELEQLADRDQMVSASSIHAGGRGLVFADCVNYRLVKSIPVATLRALLTKAGGEKITRQQLVDDGVLAHTGWYAQIP